MTPETRMQAAGDAPAHEILDYDALRARLAAQGGPRYWRSLEELAGRDEIDALVHREFPAEAGGLLDDASRRSFMKVMGASMMLAGLAGCARQPEEKIVPYVKAPEETIPGKTKYYATAMPLNGYGTGLLAVSYEGRPIRLEGAPNHPASLGATDLHAQASILELYSPDRLDVPMFAGHISTWQRFVAEAQAKVTALGHDAGRGVRFLTGTVTSPTLAWQLQRFLAANPEAKWHQWEPLGRDHVRAGALLAFGEYADTVYDFSKARVVLSLDSNFLTEGPGHVRHARDFAAARDVDPQPGEQGARDRIVRLYAAESSPGLTGAAADHRVALRYPDVETLARLVAEKLGIAGVTVADGARANVPASFVDAVAADLSDSANRGRSIAIAGDLQPPAVHALAHAINAALNNTGTTVRYIEPVEAQPADQGASFRQLVDDINAGAVSMLVMIGGNPVYDAPADLAFGEALLKLRDGLAIHLTNDYNETSHLCHWAIPEAHYLEAWSDVRAFDGTATIVQPLILPLHSGKSAHELMSVLLTEEPKAGLDLLKASWIARRGLDGFDAFWRAALGAGTAEGTASAEKTVTLRGEFPPQSYTARPEHAIDVVWRPCPHILEGNFTNNSWLQELPRPLTKLTWDNAVFMHPKTARSLGVKHEDLVDLDVNGRTVRGPVMIQMGHPEGAATVHLGYGRERAGKAGSGVGFNAYAAQSAASPWFATGATVRATGRTYLLARTEEHWNIEQNLIEEGQKAEDRHLIREAPLATFLAHNDFAQHMGHHAPDDANTLYDPVEKDYTGAGYSGYSWGMTIDLNKCTGCGVCSIACQAENNIPVVGKEQVRRGREMHWIRIDRYYKGDFAGTPEAVFQPVPCQHCENAPCEPVCPVGATMHSKEGLNDMVYNRCVGTRYCANNCPYKVRRYNYYHFNIREGQDAPSLKMMRNPNVTVRSRGVMEKCTYCVQRINAARIETKKSGTKITDGMVTTACQAACPSGAIAFGDVNDQNSRVSQLKGSGRNYALIGDIGTRPRTTYLAKVTNPSPALGGGGAGGAHGAASEH